MTKKTNLQNNTKPKDSAKPRYPEKDYNMVYGFKSIPFSKERLDDIAEDLMKWADTDEKALKLNLFLRKNKISRTKWYQWIKENEKLAEAHRFALNCIGDTREIGMLERRYREKGVIFMMPHYDEDWAIREQEQSKLKQDPEQKPTTVKVVMEDFRKKEEK